MEERFSRLVTKQREYFQNGATVSVTNRLRALQKLYDAIVANEQKILSALTADLGKTSFEGYMCEVGLALSEIRYVKRHLKKWAKARSVRSPLAQFPSKCYRLPSPYGNVLIMSPWNYPFLLTISPLVDALAAGNVAIVKPSAYAPHTSEVLETLLTECFNEEYVAVVTGGRAENAALLDEKFDFIFFTGSQAVGKEVLRKCAERLTPAVLELGGKSPCIVDSTANIELAARRIVFGKYLNCGQTCVAPDYVLCDERIKAELVRAIGAEISKQFGDNPLKNDAYGHIINEKHFRRLCGLIEDEKLIFGGGRDALKLKIEPTVLDATWESPSMQEEIFGPILPVLTYRSFDEVYKRLNSREKPLALYLFSEDEKRIAEAERNCSFGGGCINDTVVHLATSEMGFGGVGESGMGAYHGKVGFDTFSYEKSILRKSTRCDLPIRYQPYGKKKEGWLRKFLK